MAVTVILILDCVTELSKSNRSPSGLMATLSASSLGCPICLGLMRNAEVLPTCGHSFCAACIEALPADFSASGTFEAACPLCRVPFALGSSVPNWSLREILPDPVLKVAMRGGETTTEQPHNEPAIDLEPGDGEEAAGEEAAAAVEDSSSVTDGATPDVDVGAALVACRKLVGSAAFCALRSNFVKAHCQMFEDILENKLEHTTLHEEYVALVESEIVCGLQEDLGPTFDMAAFLAALPEYVQQQRHSWSPHDVDGVNVSKSDGDGEEEAEAAPLAETLDVLNRFGSFAHFKAEMVAAKARETKSKEAMAAGAALYFSRMPG